MKGKGKAHIYQGVLVMESIYVIKYCFYMKMWIWPGNYSDFIRRKRAPQSQ